MDPLSLRLTGAYLLDWAIGDPRWLPHPVRGLGWLIRKGEHWLRARIRREEWAGTLLVIGIVPGTWFGVSALLHLSGAVSPWAGWGTEILLLFCCLSTRDLAVETWPVHRALQAGRLGEARRHVAMIVGRDTDSLNEPEIVRATLETVAESTMDGIVAPLFYAVIGGAPLACLYKAVNTLDSMVGYRSARYLKFGRAAAQVDRWMNWVPARCTALLLAGSAPLMGLAGGRALQAVRRDAVPTGENSFLPEAAMAGALGVRLGGINFYQGKPVQAPPLGDPIRPLRSDLIPPALRLMMVSSVLGFLLLISLRLGGAWWIR